MTAVQAGGDARSLRMGSSQVTQFYKNGTMQDLGLSGRAHANRGTPIWTRRRWRHVRDRMAGSASRFPSARTWSGNVEGSLPGRLPHHGGCVSAEGERLKGDGLYAMTFLLRPTSTGRHLARRVDDGLSSFGGKVRRRRGQHDAQHAENGGRGVPAHDGAKRLRAGDRLCRRQNRECLQGCAPVCAFPSGLFGYRYVNRPRRPAAPSMPRATKRTCWMPSPPATSFWRPTRRLKGNLVRYRRGRLWHSHRRQESRRGL